MKGKSKKYGGYKWSESELDRLKELYPVMGTSCVSTEMGIPILIITNMARRLGLKKVYEGRIGNFSNNGGHNRGKVRVYSDSGYYYSDEQKGV
jgi:hypothetical protein